MVETSVVDHQSRQCDFSRMTKRRVSQVVRQADRFHKVFIRPQGAGDGAANLSDFQGMCQASTIVVAFVIDEHLGLIFQTAECRGM